MKRTITLLYLLSVALFSNAQTTYNEPYRPQLHFSPKAHWMNDPNGMVYADGVYHLFFQHYPYNTNWGPMHWGHATSTDLIHWKELPIALYPDSLGYIFSGSAVLDKNNTSKFGTTGKPPMVAIFTYHDPKGQQAGRKDFETQAIAYSLDNAKTWTKYSGNPVVKNPGVPDFRDPKVCWFAPTKKWIMTVATQDRVTFYSSPDLKEWKRESDFGATQGAHGGVWECPDLFPLKYNGKEIWVLIANTNPGGPNGGSGTQYFTGNFDGHTFTSNDSLTKWLDYGPDEYAGVTWSNTGNDRLFIGWMTNLSYAGDIPTSTWRSSLTLVRKLGLDKINGTYRITSLPLSAALDKLKTGQQVVSNTNGKEDIKLSGEPLKMTFQANANSNFELTFKYKGGESITVGYNAAAMEYFIDRANGGNVNFNSAFTKRHTAPRFSTNAQINLTLVLDKSSLELFADNGLSVMTSTFFIQSPLTALQASPGLKAVQITTLKSIWAE